VNNLLVYLVKVLVCWLMLVFVVVGFISVMLWNGVSSSLWLSACRCRYCCSAKLFVVVVCVLLCGGVGENVYFVW